MSKTIYGALEHSFSNEWSGFVRGYGYDNRTAYDGSPYGGVLVDTRQLYSQTWDAGLRFNQDIFHSQLTSSYSHSKDYNYDPRLGRYDTSATLDEVKQYNVQWANTVDVGHGNVGAGIDWQKQTTEPGTNYVTDGYEIRNTGLFITGLQKLGDFTLEGRRVVMITRSLASMVPGRAAPRGSLSTAIALSPLMAPPTKRRISASCTASMVIRISTRKRASSGKGPLKA